MKLALPFLPDELNGVDLFPITDSRVNSFVVNLKPGTNTGGRSTIWNILARLIGSILFG
jgi:hypothetical protein